MDKRPRKKNNNEGNEGKEKEKEYAEKEDEEVKEEPAGQRHRKVPLLCSLVAVRFVRIAGQQPFQGMKSRRTEKNSIRPVSESQSMGGKGQSKGLPEGSGG